MSARRPLARPARLLSHPPCGPAAGTRVRRWGATFGREAGLTGDRRPRQRKGDKGLSQAGGSGRKGGGGARVRTWNDGTDAHRVGEREEGVPGFWFQLWAREGSTVGSGGCCVTLCWGSEMTQDW